MSFFNKPVRIILVLLFVSSFLLIFFAPKPPLLQNISFSTAVYDSHGRLLRMTLSQDEKYRLFTPLADIPKQLINATLLQEDQYFRWHPGVNPLSLFHAAWQTFVLHSRRMGASTVTMQLARVRYGIHTKNMTGKLKQIGLALQLERYYSKDEILEAYLNLAPYGGNIEGVAAASLVYFGKSVQTLTLPEALTLSVMPQNPLQRTPGNNRLKQSRDKLFTRWTKQYPEDANQQAVMMLPMQMQTRTSLPFKAPHFVNSVLKESSEKQVITTLDLRLQTLIERITKNFIKRKEALGVHNAAVLLVDTRDMGIKAMLGSANFFDAKTGGQINGTETRRSPGSTLKPFIYGLALDQGLIHPNTVLKDVPHSFGSYNPENFDYDFMGPVKARDALVLSRNIPALYLASQLKNPDLYQLLSDAGVYPLKSESYYGLSLALGGAEMTMQELAGLYAMLANDGLWHPLRTHAKTSTNISKRLLSPEASFLVLDMLKNNENIAWKTGTSSGYRDAWSVGVAGPYVLAVWIGNFDNSSNPAFVGKNIAAPLFFEIIDGMTHEQGSLPVLIKQPQHMNLTQIDVCKASGMLPTRFCQDTEKTWFIPGKSPIKKDTVYREVAIDNRTGMRTCHIDEHTHFEVYEFWPTDLLSIFRKAGIQRRTPPFYSSECAFFGNHSNPPQITSPQSESSYIQQTGVNDKNIIPLSAVTDADVATLYWFDNNQFLAKTAPDIPVMWQAKPGTHIIRAVDDHGLTDSKEIRIELTA